MEPQARSLANPTLLATTPEFWVVDKPAGWLCVPGRESSSLVAPATQPTPVLIDWVRRELGDAWVCHRLDRGTSGVWLVARSAEAHRRACGWFEDHAIKKEYVFLAEGKPKLPVMRMDLPIEGQPSVTQVELRKVLTDGFYGVARPQSGRRHQIRIHLGKAGHPIWGDVLYGSSRRDISRTALHARALVLPKEGGGKKFEARLPPDFEGWLRAGGGP